MATDLHGGRNGAAWPGCNSDRAVAVMANSSTKQRYISTSIWDDDWFSELDPDAKLLYFYLLTNEKTNVAGVYQISCTRITRDTGMARDAIMSQFEEFERCQKVYYRMGYVILPNAPKHQKYELRGKIKAAIISVLNALPSGLIESFLSSEIPYQFDLSMIDRSDDYVSDPIDTVSIPYDTVSIPNDTVTSNHDSDSDSDSDSEKESPVAREPELGDFRRLHDDFVRIAGRPIPPSSYQTARMLLSKYRYEVVWYEVERAIGKSIRDPMRYVHAYMSKPGYDPPDAEVAEVRRREEFVETKIDPDMEALVRRVYGEIDG
jgi:hypothetical protein